MNKQFAEKWQRWLGSSYEIRIRVTLGLMFLLIIIANLNSLRFFGASKSLQNSTTKSHAVENLGLLARLLRANPLERSQTTQFRDLVQASGFVDLVVIETDRLQHDDSDSSSFVHAAELPRLRAAYNREKEIAATVVNQLPATISSVYANERSEHVRSVIYHFRSETGQALSLVATVRANIEVGLERFSTLNMLFQFLSIAAALTIAILLLQVTLKPYRLIKDQALQAKVGAADQPESVDFAVQTFQKVIGELRHKEAVLQRLYAQQKDRATSLERYNEYILAGMSSAVIGCDSDGAITHFNCAAERVCGLESAAVISQEYHYALADFPVFTDLIGKALERGIEASLPELELRLPDGNSRWLSVTCTRLRDTAGSPQGVMLLISDLTELKRLEAEIRIKEQLAALGEMAAGLAHQLRNSLAAVVGFAQLLKKLTGGTEKASDVVLKIISEAQASEEMLTRFLRLSRSENTQLNEVNFAQIQAAVETHFSDRAFKAGVSLRFVVDEELGAFVCDPILISNVLINLIQNSIEASTPGSETRIEVHRLGRDQAISLIVSDNGKGIPPEEIDKIFLPFFTSGKADGTGLGLSLVRKWVLLHGGDIRCTSTPGIGTNFNITLPQHATSLIPAAVPVNG